MREGCVSEAERQQACAAGVDHVSMVSMAPNTVHALGQHVVTCSAYCWCAAEERCYRSTLRDFDAHGTGSFWRQKAREAFEACEARQAAGGVPAKSARTRLQVYLLRRFSTVG